MSKAEHLMGEYLERTKRPGPHHNDVFYNYQLGVLRDVLVRLEAVLVDQGILSWTDIENVLRSMLYGSPHPADAEMRLAERELLVNMLSIPPARVFGTPT